MNLHEREAAGEIVGQASSPEELASLLRMAQRRASDAALEELSPESRMVNAYQCILACAKAALRAQDYRVPEAMRQHYITIETLRDTLGVSEREVAYFQILRRKRHKDEYEGTLEASQTEAQDACMAAQALLARLQQQLIPDED